MFNDKQIAQVCALFGLTGMILMYATTNNISYTLAGYMLAWIPAAVIRLYSYRLR